MDVIAEIEDLRDAVKSLQSKNKAFEDKHTYLMNELNAQLYRAYSDNEPLRARVAELEAVLDAEQTHSSMQFDLINDLKDKLEAKHEAVEPVAWIETDGKMTFCKSLLISERTPLYCVPPPPPSTQAAVAAALRKAAAEFRDGKDGVGDAVAEKILALLHDDSHLRELMMRVANAVWDDVVRLEQRPNELQDIVDRVLKGE